MLQTISSSGQAMLASTGNDTLPAGFAQAQAGTDGFEVQLALQALTAGSPLPDGVPQGSTDAVPTDARKTPEEPPEADVQQWLQSMLEQQTVRVEAREGIPQAVDQDGADLPSREGMDEPSPVLPVLPSVDAQPAPVRQPDALRQALPAIASGQPAAAPAAEVTTQVSNLLLAGGVDESLDSSLIERVLSTTGEADGAPPAAASNTVPSSSTPAAERTLRLHAPQAQWGEQMLQSLREHVDLQISQRIQNATIRLDPPELGSLEIYLSHESGRLSVQLSAANADVARLLQHTSERLRQELVGQNFVQVNVQVSSDSQGGRQHEQAPRQAWLGEEAVQAARSMADDERSATKTTRDVLVTV